MTTVTHRRRTPSLAPPRTPADNAPVETEGSPVTAEAAEEAAAAPTPGPQYLRLGSIGLRSAAAYLLVWSLVLFVVTMVVFAVGYVALDRLGVLASLSESAATVLSEPLPDSGLLPGLQFGAVLPYALLGAGALSLLWLCGSFAFVCVHNAVSALTSGLRVRTR